VNKQDPRTKIPKCINQPAQLPGRNSKEKLHTLKASYMSSTFDLGWMFLTNKLGLSAVPRSTGVGECERSDIEKDFKCRLREIPLVPSCLSATKNLQ